MIEKGKIITFEGMDGCFKETNSKRLESYLNDKGIKTTRIAFPTYKEGSYVSKYLKGDYKDTSPIQVAALFALDRYDTIQSEDIINRLNSGEWFIFDRYVDSNIIYQVSDINDYDLINWIYKFEYNILELPEPDATIGMVGNFDLIMNEIINKRDTKDIHESNTEYLKKVYSNYKNLCNSYYTDYWEKIDVTTIDRNSEGDEIKFVFRDKDAIFLDIVKALSDILPPSTSNKELVCSSNYNKNINQLINTINFIESITNDDTIDNSTNKVINTSIEYCKNMYQYVDSLTKTLEEFEIVNTIGNMLINYDLTNRTLYEKIKK